MASIFQFRGVHCCCSFLSQYFAFFSEVLLVVTQTNSCLNPTSLYVTLTQRVADLKGISPSCVTNWFYIAPEKCCSIQGTMYQISYLGTMGLGGVHLSAFPGFRHHTHMHMHVHTHPHAHMHAHSHAFTHTYTFSYVLSFKK